MPNRICKGLAALLTAALLIAAVSGVAELTRVKDGQGKNQDFYAQQQDFDVLFFGTSHSVLGILPMELYRNNGIVSYNLGNHGQWPSVDYWVLKNALRYTTPKLVVLESYAVFSQDRYSADHIGFLHEMFDTMPWSLDKLRAVNDLFEDPLRKEFLLPFSSYHSRWDTLDESAFCTPESTHQRGADENGLLHTNATTLVQSCAPTVPLSVGDTNDTPTVGKEYLEKSIALCKEKGIDVLLCVSPFCPTDEAQRWANSVDAIAKRQNVTYLNGLQMPDLIDSRTDLWDAGHLNSSGAVKWTDFLGDYIQSHYALPDRRGDGNYANWATDYAAYAASRAALLQAEPDFYNLLVLIQHPQYEVCVSIDPNSAVYDDELACLLLENLSLDGFEQARQRRSAFSGATDANALAAMAQTPNLFARPPECGADIRIVLFDRQSGACVDRAFYTAASGNHYDRYDGSDASPAPAEPFASVLP